MLKTWAAELQTEIDGKPETDAALEEKQALLKSILSKCKSAVDVAPTAGAKLSGSDFSRDQTSRLRSSESALSSIEFTGRDYDSSSKLINQADKILISQTGKTFTACCLPNRATKDVSWFCSLYFLIMSLTDRVASHIYRAVVKEMGVREIALMVQNVG